VNEDGSREPVDVRRAARPYAVAVGVIFLVVIVLVSVNTISNKPIGLKAGDRLPKFAAPSATGATDKDANVNPSKACGVKGGDAIRICDYFDRPLVIVAWFTKGCDSCPRQLDTVEEVRRRFPKVAFVGLDIKDSLANAGSEVRKHGWGFPMALDRDGAVSGLYGVVVGPTTFFAYPKGILMGKSYGELDQAQLTRKVDALIRATRQRQSSQTRR
jgi:peroxiredoxin